MSKQLFNVLPLDSQMRMPGVTRQPRRLTGACIGERWSFDDFMDIIVMMGPLYDGNYVTRNEKKQVGNYGGGGAVQKLHPKKAQTLAIIKVVYCFFIKT